MRIQTTIINFGNPKTATTYVLHLFFRACPHNYFSTRLMEGCPLHPRNSDKGLYELAHFLQKHPLNFVRTKRHPVDYVEALCYIHKNRIDVEHELDRWIELYRNESESVTKQRPKLDEMGVRLIDIEYSQFGNQEIMKAKFNQIVGVPAIIKENWLKYIDITWNKRPVRPGKLSSGTRSTRQISDKWVERINTELADIIRAEDLTGLSIYEKLPREKK